jgi:hypothetical protein
MRTLVALIFAVAIAALVAMALDHPKPTARELREALLHELQPVTLANCTLERIGSANDGGYLMCGNLLGGGKAAYSYGIGPADDWGCDVSQRIGVVVHQYDCFNPPEGACSNGRSQFHNECVGPRGEVTDGRVFDTLTNQIARNGDADKILIVKIDIEGAELDSLMTTSDGVLARHRSPFPRPGPEVEAHVLSCAHPLQQPGLHAAVQAVPGVGVSGAVRQQAPRRPRPRAAATDSAASAGCPGLRHGQGLSDAAVVPLNGATDGHGTPRML